jgi:ABC-2 type transporter
MPLQVPVFKREIMNHMYSPSAYFFARTLSGMLVQVIAPILMTIIVFFGLGVPITFDGIVHFMGSSIQLALVGCAIGYWCGLMFDDDNIARGICMMFTLIFMLVSGGLNNAADYPPVVDQMQYISPNRYALENYFRVLSEHLQYN